MRDTLGIKCVLLAILCLLVTNVNASARFGPQESTREEARRLWEQAIAAKGGRERLYEVGNMEVSARAQFKKDLFHSGELRFEDFYVFPSKHWSWSDERATGLFPLAVEWVDLERSLAYLTYADDPESPRKGAITPFKSSFFIKTQLVYLMETPWLKPVPVKTRTEHIGFKKVDVVETSVERDRVDYYLDRTTHLPVRVVTHYASKNETGLTRTYVLEEYKEVNGIQMPHTVNAQGLKQRVTYQINVPYNKELFECPPTIEAGPDAWRPKRQTQSTASGNNRS